jgi:hypothetical protein
LILGLGTNMLDMIASLIYLTDFVSIGPGFFGAGNKAIIPSFEIK